MSKYTLPNDFTPRFLESLDGRTIAARMLRERLAEVQSDLGGADSLSYAQRSIARRAIWLESWLETQEFHAAKGQQIDIGRQTQALNTLLGLFRAIGLERRARDVPSLHEYLAHRQSEAGA